MNAIECCQIVLDNKTAKLLRVKKDSENFEYDIKDMFSGNNKKWFVLDLFSASAVISVFNAVKPELKEKMKTCSIEKLCHIAFKVMR